MLFVEAVSEEDARAIARNHIERTFGIDWFSIQGVSLAEAVPAGRVKG